jgi:flagellar hook assembly protein FlgD
MSIFTFRFTAVAIFINFLCIVNFFTLTNAAQGDAVKGPEISGVRVSPQRFNPVKGEVTTISYDLSNEAISIIKIFDPERRLVRDLIPEDTGDPGLRSVIWDGRDLEGRIVPDEAYIFTIEITDYRGNFNYYDPTTFSGGEYFEPAVEFKEQNRTVNYPLDRDARVRIRAGIQGGPLLKAIANWSPRLAGNNEDNWDGMDESGTLMAVRQKKFKLTAEAVTLPENTILTTGNERDTYYGYLNEIHERPRKVDRPFYKSKSTLPGYQYGDIVDYGIKLKAYLKLPKPAKTNMGGLPILDGKVKNIS